jgi:hypothetical protein
MRDARKPGELKQLLIGPWDEKRLLVRNPFILKKRGITSGSKKGLRTAFCRIGEPSSLSRNISGLAHLIVHLAVMRAELEPADSPSDKPEFALTVVAFVLVPHCRRLTSKFFVCPKRVRSSGDKTDEEAFF